jgi:parallel beta-helix repeat protein
MEKEEKIRKTIYLIISILVFPGFNLLGTEQKTISTSEELQAFFEESVDSMTVQLLPGTYHLSPSYLVEPTCGNCEDPGQDVFISVGLRISGNSVKISGPVDGNATIYTHSGYGLFFNDCHDCSIQNLSITGGIRDADQKATDAAVVAKNSSVTVINCQIHDNIGDSSVVNTTIVGIMGICGRENSKLTISGNKITRNSWDGIALYRDAEATISNNLIDGVDKATGKTIGGGRGVGIGVTWNAKAHIEENLIKRYWKGIGLFVDAEGTVRNNIIEDILTWGVALWDAGKGVPIGMIEGNVIYRTGACGASITRSRPGEKPGHFTGNIIIGTGKDPRYDSPDLYCYQCAIALQAVPENFQIKDNICFNNRRASDNLPDFDIPKIKFRKKVLETCGKFSGNELLTISDFFNMFCNESQKFNLYEELFQ